MRKLKEAILFILANIAILLSVFSPFFAICLMQKHQGENFKIFIFSSISIVATIGVTIIGLSKFIRIYQDFNQEPNHNFKKGEI